MSICLIEIEKVYVNLILTDSDNIDWNDKSIIDISKLKDFKMKRNQELFIIDRDNISEIKKIKVKDLNIKNLQINFVEI
jgi:hypothetical protein